MRTGLPAALLRGTPSAIRDDRFTRCPFPAATTHAPVALARSSNTAMEHRNRCTDLRHPELLATSLLKCPRQDCCETPSETKKVINIFLSKDVLGGGDIKPKQGFRGSYASYDLAQHDEVSHITIDKMDAIHQQLIAKVVQLTAAPAKAEGEGIPLRYVVPASEEIELWDSGMAVTARSRDTLQTLALRYRLPQWSLTQINQMPDNAPLTAGERIIVPRHLTPLTTVSEPVSSRP